MRSPHCMSSVALASILKHTPDHTDFLCKGSVCVFWRPGHFFSLFPSPCAPSFCVYNDGYEWKSTRKLEHLEPVFVWWNQSYGCQTLNSQGKLWRISNQHAIRTFCIQALDFCLGSWAGSDCSIMDSNSLHKASNNLFRASLFWSCR